MDIGQKLRNARKAKGLIQVNVAVALSVTQGAVRQWETGATTPSARKLAKVAAFLDIPVAELLDPPLGAQVTAGRDATVTFGLTAAMYDPALFQICDLWDASDETVPCVIDRDGIFAVRIQGDSMEPDLHDGDVVAVDPNTLPATGDTAIVCLRTEGLVIKRWYWRNGIIRLESLNPEGKTYQWPKDEVFQKGLILWRWKVLGILWHKL